MAGCGSRCAPPLGEWQALVLWCSIAVIAFTATALVLGERFAISAVNSAGASAQPLRARRNRPIRFRRGLGRALRLKEWRLLGRDPWLVSQIMLQVIYTLPVSIVIWRSQGPNGSLAISVAPAVVVIASQIAASLAWLTISSEDAPEFLATAPVAPRAIEWRKLEAIAAPMLCFLCAPLLALAWSSVELAIYTGVFAAGAAASTAFLNFWHPMPGRRAAVLRRHSQSKLVAILEHLLSLLWAVAMVLACSAPFM
jgi:ABC-2 type transport system permease protein